MFSKPKVFFMLYRPLKYAMRTLTPFLQHRSVQSMALTSSLTSLQRNSKVQWWFVTYSKLTQFNCTCWLFIQLLTREIAKDDLLCIQSLQNQTYIYVSIQCIVLNVHLNSWMVGLNLCSHCLHAFLYPGDCFNSIIYLFSTDLYLRVNAVRAPLFTGLKTEGLPAKFDWREKAVVVPVQNQQTVRSRHTDHIDTLYVGMYCQCSHGCMTVEWKRFILN